MRKMRFVAALLTVMIAISPCSISVCAAQDDSLGAAPVEQDRVDAAEGASSLDDASGAEQPATAIKEDGTPAAASDNADPEPAASEQTEEASSEENGLETETEDGEAAAPAESADVDEAGIAGTDGHDDSAWQEEDTAVAEDSENPADAGEVEPIEPGETAAEEAGTEEAAEGEPEEATETCTLSADGAEGLTAPGEDAAPEEDAEEETANAPAMIAAPDAEEPGDGEWAEIIEEVYHEEEGHYENQKTGEVEVVDKEAWDERVKVWFYECTVCGFRDYTGCPLMDDHLFYEHPTGNGNHYYDPVDGFEIYPSYREEFEYQYIHHDAETHMEDVYEDVWVVD